MFSVGGSLLNRQFQNHGGALQRAMQKVLTKPVIWKQGEGWRLKSDLGAGITATLFPGSSEHDAVVTVSDGKNEMEKKFPEMWRTNWKIERSS